MVVRKLAPFTKGTDLQSFMEKEYNDLVMMMNRIQGNQSSSTTVSGASLLPVTTMLWSDAPDLDTWTRLAGSGWVLADGSDVTGSTYHKSTNRSTVPDLRGRYPRMRSYTSGNNPDGDLVVRTTQADQVGSHGGHILLGGGSAYGSGSPYTDRLSSAGGNETRPKTMVLNCFIKIN